jgi:hypothetical protein
MSHALTQGTPPISATTFAAVRAGIPLRDAGHVRRGQAIYHDLTGELQASQGEHIPILTPQQAAGVALAVAREHDLTLFEYFLTDRAGHSQDYATATAALDRLDQFLAELLPSFMTQGALVLFSDHGNIEDLSVPTHTRNPVPLAVWSPGRPEVAEAARACTWLGDVAGLLVDLAVPARPAHEED